MGSVSSKERFLAVKTINSLWLEAFFKKHTLNAVLLGACAELAECACAEHLVEVPVLSLSNVLNVALVECACTEHFDRLNVALVECEIIIRKVIRI